MPDHQLYPDFSSSKLRVHVAFHLTPGREQYLRPVLAAIDEYRFAEIDVVIDTNSAEAEQLDLGDLKHIRPRYAIHDRLQDPFALTWQHRPAMQECLDDFDYFMYVEDDMLVPWPGLQRWLQDSRQLQRSGYRRGFLRTEIDPAGTLVSTDQTEPSNTDTFAYAAGKEWFYPANPYHAFWICSRGNMREFVDSQAWQDGNHWDWGIRERAAAGMIWMDSEVHRSLVPMQGWEVHPDSLIPHLPNNYAEDPASEYGKIPVSELGRSGLGSELYRRWRRLVAYLSRS